MKNPKSHSTISGPNIHSKAVECWIKCREFIVKEENYTAMWLIFMNLILQFAISVFFCEGRPGKLGIIDRYHGDHKHGYGPDYKLHKVMFILHCAGLVSIVALKVLLVYSVLRCVLKKFTISLVILFEGIFTTFMVLELSLLADQSVHVIDLDLVDNLGIGAVLKRQAELGAGLPKALQPYSFLLLPSPFIIEMLMAVGCYFLKKKTPKKAFTVFFGLLVIIAPFFFGVTKFEHFVLKDKVENFHGALPLNPFAVGGSLIDVKVKTQVPELGIGLKSGGGYPQFPNPVLRGGSTNKPPVFTMKNKSNVIHILQESYRLDEWERGPETKEFFAKHEQHCVSPTRVTGNGHVTEMAMFASMYGAHPYHYLNFMYERVSAFPLELLRQNGYGINAISASTIWGFPNTNLREQFDKIDSFINNEAMLPRVDEFLKEKSDSNEPFYAVIFLHRHSVAESSPESIDKDRRKVLDLLEQYGHFDENKSIVMMSPDHGDMYGEHGEHGHGQLESSWYRQKTDQILQFCAPGMQLKEKYDTRNYVTQVDFAPTWISLLDVSPPLDETEYSNGHNFLIPKSEGKESSFELDSIMQDNHWMSPRYFPQKNKILAFATESSKYWFRVTKYKQGSRKMKFKIVKITDWQDNEVCDPHLITYSVIALMHNHHEKDYNHNDSLDDCQNLHPQKIAERLKYFEKTLFWKFFEDAESDSVSETSKLP